MLSLTRGILAFAAVAAGMYAVGCAALFAMQRSLLYYPPQGVAPDDVTLTLTGTGERILVSVRVNPGTRAVIYFGGNGEDVSRSMATLERAFPAESIYALHYRGYNGSGGSPSEKAIVADAVALFDRVHSTRPNIIMIGRSLGSGVAVQVASLRPVERLVLVTPYDSIQEMAARRFPYFPIRWLLLDKYESWRYAPRVTAPTQLLAAQYDEVIPWSSTDALYRHLPHGLATLTVVPDAGHNTISDVSEYPSLLRGTP